MYTSHPMYDCWGYILFGDEYEWTRGWDCGVVEKEESIRVVFISELDHRTKHYLKDWEVNYSEEKPE